MSKYVIPNEAYDLWNVLLIAQPKFMPAIDKMRENLEEGGPKKHLSWMAECVVNHQMSSLEMRTSFAFQLNMLGEILSMPQAVPC